MEKVSYFIGALLVVIGVALLMSFPVMWLWNYALVPAVDGINSINVYQSLCLMVLASILFKTNVNNNKNG